MITTEQLKMLKKNTEEFIVEKPKIEYLELKGLLHMFELLIKKSEEDDVRRAE